MPRVLHFLLALKIARPCQLDRYSEWITETYGMIKYLIVITEAITSPMSPKKTRGSRRKSSGSSNISKVDLEELTEIKFSVCRKSLPKVYDAS